MKIKFISLILTFLIFFSITNLYCYGEDFFLDGDFQEAKDKPVVLNSSTKNVEKTEKKGFFSKDIFNKFNLFKNKDDKEEKGYYGTLPNIEENFQYKKQNRDAKIDSDMIVPNQGIKEDSLKPAPFDDALFLDKIIKKEPDSQYVKDMQKIKYALNNLKFSIETNSDIQRFNACVNMLELLTQNLKTKYQDKSDSLKESYSDILNTNYYAKKLGNLKYDANYYSRYIPVQEGKYSKSNIKFEEEKLLNRINKTLFDINNEY